MRAIDLYAMKPIKIDKGEWGLDILLPFVDVEVDDIPDCWNEKINGIDPALNVNERVKIHYHADKDFDSRRGWVLASVWFDSMPVMIIQKSGREYEDFQKRFITNLLAFREMEEYLRTLVVNEAYFDDVIDPLENRDDLDTFHGYSLNNMKEN